MQITPFLFEGEALVRVIMRDEAPWFVAADVCRVLEIRNPSQAISRLDDDERDTLLNNEGIASAQVQQLTIISESGLWSLVLTSRKPEAKRFKKWITAEVIPSLRKTGRYEMPGRGEARQLEEQGSESSRLRMVIETRLAWGVSAAQEMWLKVGLPTVPAMFDGRQPDLFTPARREEV